MNSDVTVVIPTLWRPGCLAGLIRSIRQHDEDCEIIVVDDSGKDAYAHRFTRAKIQAINLPFDSGVSRKRNIGCGAAGTEFVLVVDDDTVFPVLKLAEMKLEMEGLNNARFLVPRNCPTKRSINPETGEIRDAPFAETRDGRPVYHATEQVLFGRRQSFTNLPWPEELKTGEHCPQVYRYAVNNIGSTPTDNMVFHNKGSHEGGERYGALRGREQRMKELWFWENTDFIDINPFGSRPGSRRKHGAA